MLSYLMGHGGTTAFFSQAVSINNNQKLVQFDKSQDSNQLLRTLWQEGKCSVKQLRTGESDLAGTRNEAPPRELGTGHRQGQTRPDQPDQVVFHFPLGTSAYTARRFATLLGHVKEVVLKATSNFYATSYVVVYVNCQSAILVHGMNFSITNGKVQVQGHGNHANLDALYHTACSAFPDHPHLNDTHLWRLLTGNLLCSQ